MNWNRNPKQKPATKPKAETEINLADAAADLAADLADVAADLADVASAKSAAKFSSRKKKSAALVLVSVSGPVLVSTLDSGSVPFLGLVPICKWVIALPGQGLLKFVSLCGAIAYGF